MIASLITTVVLSGITIGLAALYLLPVLLAWARHTPDIGSIAAINILLGWTLAGWVVALAMALRTIPQQSPTVQLVQHLPPSAPPASLPPGPGWTGPPPARYPGAAPPLVLPPPEDPPPPTAAGEPR